MSKKERAPVRMCVGCRERKKKEELVRFTLGPAKRPAKRPEDFLYLNEKRSLPGRGFYLCPTLKCFRMAQKKNHVGRILGSHGSPISVETVLAR
ncbi:MAG: YlxR family protein [Deltaproteobacteria bacterium]